MRENKKKSIFEKRGFFVMLVVVTSIMVILVVMNMIMPNEEPNSFDSNAWEDAVLESAKNLEKEETYSQNAVPVTSIKNPTEIIEEDKKTEETVSENIIDETEEKETEIMILFEKPVTGAVTKDYSPDELVYFETMNDWRTHQGIDWAADEGTEVKSVADGTVEYITEDGMLGASVTISHNGDLKTLYANLQEEGLPEVGTEVKAGDVIGKIGKTASLEITEVPHLHFEVIFQGENADPHNYFEE